MKIPLRKTKALLKIKEDMRWGAYIFGISGIGFVISIMMSAFDLFFFGLELALLCGFMSIIGLIFTIGRRTEYYILQESVKK